MTVKELKKLIKLDYRSSIVYKRNNIKVESKDEDIIVSISANAGWGGFVQYTIELE